MKLVVPNYLKNFKCDGSLCNSYCCREWKVAIDEETKNKYEKLPIEIRKKILSNLKEKEGNFYPLKLNKNKLCPFLRDDFLCDLQKNFGEEYLSNICYSYPRVTTKIQNTVFQSLTLSCPLAAKLVLFTNEFFFEEKELKNFHLGWHTTLKTNTNINETLIEDIVSAGLFILKNTPASINDRLKMLLLFYTNADATIHNKENLKNLLNSVETQSFQNEFLNNKFNNSEDIIFNKDNFLHIIIKLYDAVYDARFNNDKIKELAKIYNNNFKIFVGNFIVNNDKIFTNYLLNEFFMRAYPFAFSETFAINIKVFILSWYVLLFGLFIIYMENGLDEERLILGVRKLSERIDHGKGIIKKIIEIAKETEKTY